MSLSVKILELSGILDGIRGNELRREVSDALANGTEILLIDMKGVNFIDSSGLGALVSAMQMTRNANAKLFVCSISAQVRMLFELTKMDRIFQTFADQDEFNSQILATQ
ncbi:MAG: STAS domain-containing protein [Nostoc sp.]|jgi:anti-anti-sigma factor|uniref:STAS domain-containing protein n=1 Tax=unclassified Nostoc TaxID=2593658 RepID=UPI0022370446|nr:STAS domain-containing protein [Nostoc sp. KVJ3]MCW5313172.1 anti-sigma factor antagonist [Nostoc sp. KVJ3]